MSGSSPTERDIALVGELRRTLARLELALSQISDGLVITDSQGEILWCNGGFERLIAQPRLLLMGRRLPNLMPALFPAEGRPLQLQQLLQRRPEGGTITAVAHRDPLQVIEVEWRPVLSEASLPFIFRFHDVSDRVSLEELRVRSEELLDQQLQLAAQVVTCPVTGLPNRRGLLQAIDAALENQDPQAPWLAVLFCDLNRFKEVNDTYGHQVGDQLLIDLSKRMQRVLRPSDVLSRLGGDEFVLLCCRLEHADEAMLIAQRLIEVVSQPWSPGNQSPSMTLSPEISVGIALCRGIATTAEQLLHDADLAMYEAKTRGNRQPVIFDGVLSARLDRQQQIRTSLYQILADRSMGLHLQPVVRISDGRVVGYEAFCRPVDGGGRAIEPREFIGEAESTGLIAPLGLLLLESIFAVVEPFSFPAKGLELAINFSGQQLAYGGMVEELIALSRRYRLPPGMIRIELSEAALIDQAQRGGAELSRLREAGFRLILDDFGIGHSSFNALMNLPIDGLKIDRTLTATMVQDPRRQRLIAAILTLAGDLGLDVVAEGVESCEQRQLLMDLGCQFAQGYLFGPPAPIEQFSLLPDHRQPFVC